MPVVDVMRNTTTSPKRACHFGKMITHFGNVITCFAKMITRFGNR